MRRFAVGLLVCLAVPMAITAQTMPTVGQVNEVPKATVFGGFSLLKNGGNTPNAAWWANTSVASYRSKLRMARQNSR